MPDTPTRDTPTAGDKPPDASRRRAPRMRRRLRGLFALASTLAVGVAMLVAAQPAQAMTNLDGEWTVSHGGTGQVFLNSDGTYTSTCVVYPNYEDAWCPSPSGTFQRAANAYVDFYGSDGVNHSYRMGGLVSSPDTITSYYGSRTNSPLVMKRGAVFNCTDWDLPVHLTATNPLVEYDVATGHYYLTGSHELLTNQGVAETAPQYFQNGSCDALLLPVHVIITDDSEYSSYYGTWEPRVIVTMTDRIGAPAHGVSVVAGFDEGTVGTYDCSVVSPCRLGTNNLADSTPSAVFHIVGLTRDYAQLPIAEGDSLQLTVYNPHTPTSTSTPAPTTTSTPPTTSTPAPTTTSTPPTTSTPAPMSHHIGDLDNAATASSWWSWQPKVTATVLDSAGATVAGATVSGTFGSHSGTLTCLTGANGTCTVGNFSFNMFTKSTVFTVTGVVKASSTYAPKANSDPDGDSNGTTITVKRP